MVIESSSAAENKQNLSAQHLSPCERSHDLSRGRRETRQKVSRYFQKLWVRRKAEKATVSLELSSFGSARCIVVVGGIFLIEGDAGFP
jgi:hypothetical protein